jgi:hypothetical protein
VSTKRSTTECNQIRHFLPYASGEICAAFIIIASIVVALDDWSTYHRAMAPHMNAAPSETLGVQRTFRYDLEERELRGVVWDERSFHGLEVT